jgi:hypothetical protein
MDAIFSKIAKCVQTRQRQMPTSSKIMLKYFTRIAMRILAISTITKSHYEEQLYNIMYCTLTLAKQ